ncbi:MAG TPA: nuclear transport factor 2 family protein [Gemmatimonadaceae bacterium]|nr:nuclear transport factor 2 family protein [Gemmatimonadaceae bacterium]
MNAPHDRAVARQNLTTSGALRRAKFVLLAVPALAFATEVGAQWSTTYEQTYLPARHNWSFREQYRVADRLFNAFDYGHAVLYELLYTKPHAPAARLEQQEYDFITRKLLVRPPAVPLEEAAIEVQYAKLAPEAKMMFDWAHVLHRQVYDVWADERIPLAEKDARVAELLAYYRTRPDLAFSTVPKNMELMEGQYYSGAFREKYPKFNGLIWGYHWLQVGLYEPLIEGRNVDERQTGVLAAVSRFWQMLETPPASMPRVMPMTAVVAPEFTARYPEIAIIFDNLHAMHDVISDVLASPEVPKKRKRAEILLAGQRYRDDTSFAMTRDEWIAMARAMGAENMGGVASGTILTDLPEPTVPVGASHAEAMRAGGAGHEGHAAPQPPRRDTAATGHEGHGARQPARPDSAAPGHEAHGAQRPARDTAAAHDHTAMHAAHHPPTSEDSSAVVDVMRRFRDALIAGDSVSAMALLHDDVRVLESGGIETREEYAGHHLPADMAFLRAIPGSWELVRLDIRGDAAWASSRSVQRGTFRERAVNSQGAELMVLVRTPQGWRIAAVHWSSRNVRPGQ